MPTPACYRTLLESDRVKLSWRFYEKAATFTNGSGMLIFAEISFERWAIWLWMYCRNVSDVQRPIFIIVVSS